MNYTLIEDNARLRKENELLKLTIREALMFLTLKIPPEISLDVEEEKQSWMEKSERFEGIRKLLLAITVDLVTAENAAIHQDRIIRAFAYRHPQLYRGMKDPGETLPRRLRELRQAGYLISPKQGCFFVGNKLVDVK